MEAHAFKEQLAQLCRRLVKTKLESSCRVEPPVRLRFGQFAIKRNLHPVRRRKLLDGVHHRVRAVIRQAVTQVIKHALRVHRAAQTGQLEQGFLFRRKREPTRVQRVVQRFDAERIARQEHRAACQIQNRKGEHARQSGEHFRAPDAVCLKQHLRVRR